jgi:hypothetical protein
MAKRRGAGGSDCSTRRHSGPDPAGLSRGCRDYPGQFPHSGHDARRRWSVTSRVAHSGFGDTPDHCGVDQRERGRAAVEHVVRTCIPALVTRLSERLVDFLDGAGTTQRQALASLAQFGSRAVPALNGGIVHGQDHDHHQLT